MVGNSILIHNTNSSREIWCSNRETGGFHEKLGDSRENQESWQVCKYDMQ